MQKNRVLSQHAKDKDSYVKAQVIAILHFLMTFINELVIFGMESTEAFDINWPFYIFSKLVVFILLTVAWFKIINIKLNNKVTCQRIKVFLLYFVFMLVILLLCWPGIWRWDDLITLGSVVDGRPYYWQHWLSSLYTFVCLDIIPIPGGVVLCQIVLIALIVESVVWKFYSNLNTKLIFLVYIPLCLPAVIDSNLYPIRATHCAYIELWIIAQIIGISLFNEICGIDKIVLMGVLGGLVTAWRPENFIYMVGLPWILAVTKKIHFKQVIAYVLISIFIIMSVSGVQNAGLEKKIFFQNAEGEITMEKEAYSLSSFITGLGTLVAQGEFNSNNKEADLQIISDSMDMDMLLTQGGMMTFWGGGLRNVSADKLSQLKKVYVKLVIYNFASFLKSRWELYKNTNFSTGGEICSKASAHIYDEFQETDTYDFVNPYVEFRNRYKYNVPLSVEIRKELINLMEGKRSEDYYGTSSLMVKFFYNSSPVILALFVIWVYEAIRKRKLWFGLIGCLLTKVVIIFLTAPTPYFMYYFSTYITGSIIAILWLIKEVIDKRRTQK